MTGLENENVGHDGARNKRVFRKIQPILSSHIKKEESITTVHEIFFEKNVDGETLNDVGTFYLAIYCEIKDGYDKSIPFYQKAV